MENNSKFKIKHSSLQSIGIIICKDKERTTVEYALKDSHQPIGVAIYKLTEDLPQNYKQLLPTAKEIEENLDIIFERELEV